GHAFELRTEFQIFFVKPVVVAMGVSDRPLSERDLAVGKTLGGVEHAVFEPSLVEELHPPFGSDRGIESSRRAPLQTGSVKAVEARHHAARIDLALYTIDFADQLRDFIDSLHNMPVAIDVMSRHCITSFD